MEELQGYVEHIVFRNADNGYTVLNLRADEEEVVCVGIFPAVSEGEILLLRGQYTTHATYGEQFRMQSYEVKPPEDVVSMERYLASGAIKGIGATLASRIVRKFKNDTFRIMEEEPERLAEIKGISERMAMEIANQMVEKRDLRDAMVFLGKYGITSNLAVRVYQTYGQEIYTVLKSNPYRLAEDVSGVGFRTADEIAQRIGIAADSEYRIRSGIVYALTRAASMGHTYLPREELIRFSAQTLGVSEDQIDGHVMNLAMDGKVMLCEEGVYARSFYRMEKAAAGLLLALDELFDETPSRLEKALSKIASEEDLALDERQEEAVRQAAMHGVSVLTGGPGTGKTTTIRAMIRYFYGEGYDVLLAAPTGRAAKRMSEATGYEARTIHRMLGVSSGIRDEQESETLRTSGAFEHDETNPLEADVVIVDEMSMVDITLLYALLKAIPHGCRLILVGDVDQLPSVGPGNVLRDIIDSGRFSVVTLQHIFRQASRSDIVVNAHRINQGEEVLLDNDSEDFFFLKRYDADRIINVTLQLIREKLPRYVDATGFDVQVLTPTRKGLLGVERLNVILQEHLNPKNPKKKEHAFGDRIFREGDKVMQIRNNYQLEWEVRTRYGLAAEKGLGVFNGDVGVIQSINEYSSTLDVIYDEGRVVTYSFQGLDELELAYAITIHKSQGSEYPAVVLPLLPGPQMLMNRNLIYTAVTRARKCLTIVGDEKVFYKMVANTTQQRRCSGLALRIKEAL